MSDPQSLQLSLGGGDTRFIEQIMLYEADAVANVAALKQKAATLLGGVSTGIGFWGSPGWAIGGAVALGLLENALSQSATKEGAKVLASAYEAEEKLRERGRLFPIQEIERIHIPCPQLWSANFVGDVEQPTGSFFEYQLKNIAKERGLSFQEVSMLPTIAVHAEIRFVYNGDEFITAVGAGKTMHIRWSAVAAFQPPEKR